MPDVAVGTQDELYWLGPPERRELAGSAVTALGRDGSAGWWVLTDGHAIYHSPAAGRWQPVAEVESAGARCLLPTGGELLVGTERAHLLRLAAGRLEPVSSFDRVEGREGWYTPWGGPPDTRSLSTAQDGTLYVNVHVGGVIRSDDGGGSWHPTIDLHADVHQVLAHPDDTGVVLAAAAVGLAISDDAGTSWRVETEGLHATYLRAVAVAGDAVVVTASTGPGGARSGLYRRPLDGGAFRRCRKGLPEWFSDNIDTGRLAAAGSLVAFGTRDGSVFVSQDQAESWELVRAGLPPVTSVALP